MNPSIFTSDKLKYTIQNAIHNHHTHEHLWIPYIKDITDLISRGWHHTDLSSLVIVPIEHKDTPHTVIEINLSHHAPNDYIIHPTHLHQIPPHSDPANADVEMMDIEVVD